MPKKQGVDKYLAETKRVVDEHLDRFIPSATDYPEHLHSAMRYSVFAGGKRMRPALVLATGEALSGSFSQLIYLACALEMIHTYSLIHDDLPAMDNDDLRRGKPTLHREFGEGVAILAGNGLQTLAFQLLGEIPGGRAVAEAKLMIIHRICRAIGTSRGMIAGQVVDLETQGKAFTGEELEYIHAAKTGALIQAAVSCAAVLCGSPQEHREHLSAFGANVGLAFQVIDDILDESGSSKQLGKPSGRDRVKKKATYPALYGLEESRRIARRLIDDALQEIRFLGPKGENLRRLARFISARSH